MAPIGRRECPACGGVGVSAELAPCAPCEGVGHTWLPGGPAHGARLVLGDQEAGTVVELATGERARVRWHTPRRRPDTTFVSLIDEWTDEEDPTPRPVDARLGVVSVAVGRDLTTSAARDVGDGEKDADLVDPIARRRREAPDAGGLL